MTAPERRLPTSWRRSPTVWGVGVVARVVLGTVALLVLASVLPAVIGWQSTVVTSGSMAPAVQPGDIALVRPVATADLEPGQVLLVDDPDDPGGLRLHRLVAVTADGLRLKGDANPQPDGSLVAPAAVHGVGVLRLPMIGRPALWMASGDLRPLAGTTAALVVLVALALLHQGADQPVHRPGKRWSSRRAVRRLLAVAVVLGAVAALPGAGATFTDTTTSPSVTFPVARYWSCPEAVAAAGATQYYRLQGAAVANTGSPGSAGSGGFSGTGVTFGVAGPNCGANDDQAVALDGSTGQLWSTQVVPGPQTFTVQIAFATTSGSGGKLVGFGDGSGGAASTYYDRHIYMLNSGQLAFGVWNGWRAVVTTPYAFNDGRWHLATATFSATTGTMTLYVDGYRMATRGGVSSAQTFDGYWRIGYDNLSSWPSAPSSSWFNGSLAHVSIFGTALSAAQVADQAAAAG